MGECSCNTNLYELCLLSGRSGSDSHDEWSLLADARVTGISNPSTCKTDIHWLYRDQLNDAEFINVCLQQV